MNICQKYHLYYDHLHANLCIFFLKHVLENDVLNLNIISTEMHTFEFIYAECSYL